MSRVDVKTKNYGMVDVCRILCALGIVLIHCTETPNNAVANMLVKCFSQQGVPFFFIVSGFFFWIKYNTAVEKRSYLIKYVLHLLGMYFAWQLLWFPSTLHVYLNKYPDASIVYLCALLVRNILFAGSGVYWYLLVLAESVLIVTLMKTLRMEKILFVLSLIGMILGLLYEANVAIIGITQINRLFYFVFSWSNNVIMKGIPYVYIGVWLEKNRNKINWSGETLLSIWGVLFLLNSFLYLMDGQYVLLYPLQAITLFLFATSGFIDVQRVNTVYLRELSGVIYFCHTVFIYGLVDVFVGVDGNMLVRFSVPILLSVCVYFGVKWIRLKPLAFLLNMKV